MWRIYKKLAAIFLSIVYTSLAYANPDIRLAPLPFYEQRPFITPDQVQSIYKNLVETHWVPDTGLFISFFGTQDHKLSQQASTYEQAAVGLLALRLGDIERAQGLFHFLRTAWLEGPLKTGREGISGLTNFYNAEFGGEGIEKTIHVGPNAWAGLFAASLGNRTGDRDALAWALDVARWIAQDIPHNHGGVAMGPIDGPDGVPWPKVFSTENNISYYAFLSELLRARELAPADRTWLTLEKSHVEDWLVTHAFDRLAYTMNRGSNPSGADRTRALDTITWLISAVGPERLIQRGIDPDRLMTQAKESFSVTINGLDGVDSTDQPEADLTFALPEDELVSHHGTPRPGPDQHRIIWYEGLGQYINTLNTMASFSQETGRMDKTATYAYQARHLTDQFDRASLKGFPPGTAFAYATHGKFYHDGWYTPMDALDGPPSSLIASVWRCFAGLGVDPLAGKEIASVPTVSVSMPQMATVSHPHPSILYGTSEDMVVQAWQFLNQADMDHAIQQAQATIQEWSPWALKLQEKKARVEGHLIDYAGLPEQRRKIFDYWALNDVAAAYFVLGEAFDHQGHYSQAIGAFQRIVLNYPLAQIWDPRGWFWSPLESIRVEFVGRDPRHYGDVLPPMMAALTALGKQPN